MTLAFIGYVHMFFICTECMCCKLVFVHTSEYVYMSTFVHMLSNTGILFCMCMPIVLIA